MPASYRNPKIRTVLAGIAAFIVVLAFFAILPEAVKWSGYPFLYLPARLGLVQQVVPSQVQSLDLASPPLEVVVPARGRYAIYTADRELLELDLAAKRPWIKVTSQVTGQEVSVALVVRGLRPYDTPHARGRPVLAFDIDVPGVYELSRLSLTPPEYVSVVPDYVSGKERVIAVLFAIQLGIVFGPPGWYLLRRHLARLRAVRAGRAAKRAEADELLLALKRKID